jgi:hypothetical protein
MYIMNKKILASILGGLIGLLVGAVGGGFFGLVIGGTFFGWLEFPGYPYLTGYELFTYIGIAIGALVAIPLGVIIALRIATQMGKKA